MIELLNALPDWYRIALLPALIILGRLNGWQVYEDGSILP